jgi:NIMA (never in mitosis gene a)-related kinase
MQHTVDLTHSIVGTPYYLSPEIIEGRPYSFKSDVWSLGVLLYELCALKPPFDGASMHVLSLQICRGKFPPLPNYVSA